MQTVCLRYVLFLRQSVIRPGHPEIQIAERVRCFPCKELVVSSAENRFAAESEDLLETVVDEQKAPIQVFDIDDRLRVVDDGLQQLLALAQGLIDRLQLLGPIEDALLKILVGDA